MLWAGTLHGLLDLVLPTKVTMQSKNDNERSMLLVLLPLSLSRIEQRQKSSEMGLHSFSCERKKEGKQKKPITRTKNGSGV